MASSRVLKFIQPTGIFCSLTSLTVEAAVIQATKARRVDLHGHFIDFAVNLITMRRFESHFVYQRAHATARAKGTRERKR